MKNIKSLLYAAAAVLLLPLTSCSDDDYPQVPAPAGQEVYFSNTLATSYTLTRDASTVEIPLMRIKTEEAETVQLMFEDESGLFTIPSSVTFAAGASSSNIAIAYNFNDLELATEYKISLLVMGNSSEWGQSQVELTLNVPEPWVKLGTGLYRDDIIPSLFSGLESREREVEIYEYEGRPGYYYLESPYDAVFISEWFDADPSELGNNVQAVKFIIDATDPNAVVIASQSNPQPLGCILGEDGWIYTCSIEPGTLVDGVITFPAKGLVAIFSELDGGYYANTHGLFRVVLPGIELFDYAISAAYDGMKIAADGTSSAMFNLSFGADVASYKYIIAEGDVTSDLDNVVAGIVEGSLENIAEGSVDETSIAVALDASGMCSFVAVPYDAAGEAQTDDAIIVPFFFPGQGGETIPDIECALELNTIAYYYGESYEASYPAATVLAFKLTATDVKNVVYYINTTDIIETSGFTYKEILDQFGTIDADNGGGIISGCNKDGEYIGFFQNRKPGTSYTVLIEVESIYGKKYILSATRSTAIIEYTGELVLGTYNIVDETTDCAATFTLLNTADPNQFIVSDFLLNNATMFYADYDSSANTLTLDGVEQGWEDDGCAWGIIYGWWNQANDQAYAYITASDIESENIDDPVVFSIDPATKTISKLNTYVFISVYTYSTVTFLGNAAIFTPDSAITLGTATSSVRAKALNFASQFNKLQNAGLRRALKGSKMINRTATCASLNETCPLRTIATKAEPCARAKKSTFKVSDRAVRF